MYRGKNTDTTNPCRVLEKSIEFSLLHDVTTHWVKQLITCMVRCIGVNGEIFKVPCSMKQVPGGFTGEALAEELIQEISSIKHLKDNAADQIPSILMTRAADRTPEQQLKQIHIDVKVCYYFGGICT